jgi:hypothetical protein
LIKPKELELPGMKFTTSTWYFFSSILRDSVQKLKATFDAAYGASPGRACGIYKKNKKYNQDQPKFKLSHLQGTMTGHIYNTTTILSQQRQKFLCHFHVAQKVDVDLLFNNFISLPFKFPKTHDTSIVNQRIKS